MKTKIKKENESSIFSEYKETIFCGNHERMKLYPLLVGIDLLGE